LFSIVREISKEENKKMVSLTFLVTLLAIPLAVLSSPTKQEADELTHRNLFARQRLPAPPPCVRMNPAPSQDETKARFDKFVQAFVGPKKDISEAFKYIANDYIVWLQSIAFPSSKLILNLLESQPNGQKWSSFSMGHP
jgi:hypothetical protein